MAKNEISFILPKPDSDIPIYRQIYETIRRGILSGEFGSQARLPASRLLAKQLGVSRMTVINAYEQLFAEGYLSGKPGSGTFVAAQLPEEFLQIPKAADAKTGVEPPKRRLSFSAYGTRIADDSTAILSASGPTAFVPFQHGVTAIDKFPFDIWAKIAAKHLHSPRKGIFGYDDPAGHWPLREAIAAHLRTARAVNCDADQVLILNGAQQAFDLAAKIFLDEKASVLVEDPCHAGAKRSFESVGAKVVAVPIDSEGFDIGRAPKNTGAKLVYVTPSHQFPMGVTMSLSRRLALLEWAQVSNAWIVEDDYDSEFRYAGRPLASLQGLDKNNRVIYVGTFSKTIFPALRIGHVVVPKDLVSVFTAGRALNGGNSPTVDQAILAEFITEGHFARHVRRMRKLYEERQALLLDQLHKYIPSLRVEKMDAGMHLVGWLDHARDAREIAAKARDAGLKVTPLSTYAVRKIEPDGLILGYAGVSEKQIREGVKKLARIL
jgi:GntR family transcriptional regulator/MocR family aminotransferase